MADEGTLDIAYYRGIPAILKLCETLFSLIAFICVVVVPTVGCVAIAGFFNFVVMAGFVLTLILWLIHLFKLDKRICRCDCCRWPLLEFIYYIVAIIFYFFASLFLAIFACKTAHEAGAAFGFFALVVFIVDTFLSFRVYTHWKSERHTTTTTTTTTASSAEGGTQYTQSTITKETSVKY